MLRFIFFLFIFFAQVGTSSSTVEKNEIPRTSEFISIDGVADDAAWSSALQIELSYEVEPGESLQSRVKTTAYIISNDSSVFILFKAYDPDPEQIRTYLSERDDISNSDHVSILLDTFSDSRKAFKFSVNAVGVQSDAIIDEIASVEDIGWDGIWQSAGRLSNEGYQVEIAIPFRSLRFEDKKGPKLWNIKLERVWPRRVVYYFANVRNDRDSECELCQYYPVTGFSNITPAKNVTLIPAITLSKSESRASTNEQWGGENFKQRESLDLRWGINQNLYFNATLNPDFSQVEADSVQLESNKRFAIKTTEKRAFFLDGADYFSNWSKLIHTRLFIEPQYGIKLTGKNGDHSYGVIALKDQDTNFLITDNQSSRLIRLDGVQSENQIVRYRYDAGENGNLGVTYTRRDAGEYSNELVSLDGKYWFNPSTYFKFQALTTDTRDFAATKLNFYQLDNQNTSDSGNAYSINLTHANRDWSARLTHHRFEDGIRADSGFVSRSNWVSTSARLEYRWYPDSQSNWWKKIDTDFTASEVKTIDGERLELFRQGGIEISAKYQSYFGFRFFDDTQNLIPQKILSSVNPNLYTRDYEVKIYEAYGGFSPMAGLDFETFYEWGDDVDFSSAELGKLQTVKAVTNYQLNDHWRFTVEYINQSLRVAEQTSFDVHLSNLKANYRMDVNQSLRLTLQSQREGVDKSLASQLLYSYELNPFTLFYLGYSDNMIANLQNNQLERVDRTLFVKFSYAWQL